MKLRDGNKVAEFLQTLTETEKATLLFIALGYALGTGTDSTLRVLDQTIADAEQMKARRNSKAFRKDRE